MIERPFSTFALSLCIVFGGMSLLYRPMQPSTPRKHIDQTSTLPTPTVARAWDGDRDPLEQGGDLPDQVVTRATPPEESIRLVSAGDRTGRRYPTTQAAHPRKPVRSYTRVAPGETLAEIAERVYGSAEWRQKLWWANRDQLSDQRSPLEAGAILRTPILDE